MGEKVNFAWPVTSTNREDYEAFCDWLNEHSEIVEENTIAIWGAGIRGTEFSIFFRCNDCHNIVFTDSNEQKWGGTVDEFPIISPDEVYKKMSEGNTKILISVENSALLEKQLRQRGYAEEKDFYVIRSVLYEKYEKEFFRKYSNEILILGDCEFSKISMKDENLMNLGEMIRERCGEHRVKILAMHGMGLRSYYHILRAQIHEGMKPKVLFLMVNFDTLTGHQHLLPRSQHYELLKRVYDGLAEEDQEFQSYLQLAEERSRNIQTEFFVQESSNPHVSSVMLKARNYFKLNYMYRLNMETEGMAYLKRILECAEDEKITVIPFIPPVNYTLGETLHGENFRERYAQNVGKVQTMLESEKTALLDMSYCLDADMFAEPSTPDETANYKGRLIMTEIFAEEIQRYAGN